MKLMVMWEGRRNKAIARSLWLGNVVSVLYGVSFPAINPMSFLPVFFVGVLGCDAIITPTCYANNRNRSMMGSRPNWDVFIPGEEALDSCLIKQKHLWIEFCPCRSLIKRKQFRKCVFTSRSLQNRDLSPASAKFHRRPLGNSRQIHDIL